MWSWVDRVPWSLVVLACLTLGLAPFAPPHVAEKLRLLARLELHRALDWLDLLWHGAPWILLLLKLFRWPHRATGAAA